jgi:hypothetical protein
MMPCGGVPEISESVLGHLRFLYGENVASNSQAGSKCFMGNTELEPREEPGTEMASVWRKPTLC